MIALLVTALTGLASAFIPAIPIEPYILGLLATTTEHPAEIGLAAAVGQTVGKVMIFLGIRGSIRSNIVQRWLTTRTRPALDQTDNRVRSSPKRRNIRSYLTAAARLTRLLDRAELRVPILLLSAVVGMPPLLISSAYVARTRMSAGTFAAICLLGRSVRFIAIGITPELFFS
jgi:membrane protein YqaA with SNARE-associated domain